MKFAIGQTLWFAPHLRHKPTEPEEDRGFEVTVTKVGLKYLQVTGMSGLRRSAFELVKDGLKERNAYYNQAGRAYLTREDFRAQVGAEIAWSKLRSLVASNYHKPSHLTTEAINAILDILKEH